MNKKLRQITDTIHGTIYLSELESRMMSTPFFNRMNDVYQSSTVYMTYPSNRTKRYEHSIGTMELATQIFCSSIRNACLEDKRKFFANIEKVFFQKIIKCLYERSVTNTFYAPGAGIIAGIIDELMPVSSCTSEKTLKKINVAVKAGKIGDIALEHSAICFNDIGVKNSTIDDLTVTMYTFLYQCLLEAVRISALFHDAGHPPYSHIVEEALTDLYEDVKKDKKKYEEKKVSVFLRSLTPYLDNRALPSLLLKNGRLVDAAMHEQIGIKILSSAFNSVLEGLLKEIDKKEIDIAYTKTLYYITIIELTFAILLEKTPEMKTIHSIISGTIDADRLDYIMRDSRNSGVNWGTVPYKRIVESAKLAQYDDVKIVKNKSGIEREKTEKIFCIAFPQKLSDDLDDLIITRYKIFNRVNYHHRSVKTASLLQQVVYHLASDYLTKKQTEIPISREIKNLWQSLDDALGQKAAERKMTQWNDSWLISVFTNALITLSDAEELSKLQRVKGDENEKNHLLYVLCLLEEVLLNKKNYFSMIKRQNDAHDLMDNIVEITDLNRNMDSLAEIEYEKLSSSDGSKREDARDALYRIQQLRHIIQTADFIMFDNMLPIDGSSQKAISDVLDVAKKNGLISDWIIKENKARRKFGVDEAIYLYTSNCPALYNVKASLTKQLKALSYTSPWLFVYVKPTPIENSQKNIMEIKAFIAKEISDKLETLFLDVYNHKLVMP